ncbi:MAG: hypothetical protein EU543_04500 [Promethearchaeota archaeon]|nr:MAG: hypothetical protein EU543_04500 [Candidatus Lokiarchaeota archaeon]
MSPKKEFRVNEYLQLRLEKPFDPRYERLRTNIYVDGKFFRSCKYLLLNIPVETSDKFDDVNSIDEAAERLDKSDERLEGWEPKIPPEVEFWGHCSNLQVWHEHNYDTRLLHSNLAFPLLKRLTETGDIMAKQVFKEEIFKRLERGYMPVIEYLRLEGYFHLLTHEELIAALLESKEANAILELESNIGEKFGIELNDRTHTYASEEPNNIVIKNKHVIALKLFINLQEEIVKSLKKFRKIEILQIFLDRITYFPEFIFSFQDLENLSINGLEIDFLPKKICNLKKLRKIDFYECLIRKLPKCIINLKNLNILEMYDDFLDEESKKILSEINKT